MPYVEPELPTRRGLFIDIEIIGGLSIGGDIISANWDGATPLALSSADATATAGFAFDTSEGAIQVMSIFAEGGEIGNLDILGNLTMGSGGIIRTTASGQRVEITNTDLDRVSLYTGESFEEEPGNVQSQVLGSGDTLLLSAGLHAPVTNGDTGGMTLSVRSESFDDSTFPPMVFVDYQSGGGSAQDARLQLASDVVLALANLGSVSNLAIGIGSNFDDGVYSPTDGAIGIATGGTLRGTWDSAGLDIVGHVSVGDGTTSLPSIGFISDPDTGFYRSGTNSMQWVAGGAIGMSLAGTQVQSPFIKADTTGSAATLFIASTGSGRMQRSTSARKYKSHIDYDVGYLADIELKPASFYRPDDDRSYYGFIADDLGNQDTLIGEYTDGEIENYDLRAVVAILTVQLQALKQKVLGLEGNADTQ